MTELLWPGVCAGLFLLQIVVVVLVMSALRRLRAQLEQQSRESQRLSEQLQVSKAEYGEARQALFAFDKRITTLEQRLLDLASRQQEIQVVEPESKLYSRAIKMIQLGATVEEVMKDCELPPAEANMLFNIHKPQ